MIIYGIFPKAIFRSKLHSREAMCDLMVLGWVSAQRQEGRSALRKVKQGMEFIEEITQASERRALCCA